MDETRFWNLLRETRAVGSDPSAEQHAEALGAVLAELSPEEVAELGAVFNEKMDQLYTWDLWGAAYLLLGGCSDDSFEYFRAAVIARGEHAYQLGRTDPEGLGLTLVEEDVEDLDAEMLLYMFDEVYEEMTGGELPVQTYKEAPSGTGWDEDDLEEKYPRLAEALEEE